MTQKQEQGSAATAATPGRVHVEVEIPADATHLPLLRGIAAAMAVSLDFDIDTMADLRLAVDELGSTAVTRAADGSVVNCRFAAFGDVVDIAASVHVESLEPVDQSSFGWMVLETLTESVSAEILTDHAAPQLALSMSVRRSRLAQ